ncbi:MAG: nucleotidyltransferase family protein [Candidatus Omnitrophota bacterium]|jgi:hypothetical protein
MNLEENLILSLLRQLVAGAENESIRALVSNVSLDWNKVRLLLLEHDIAPFVRPILNNLDTPLPQEIREFLKSSYYLSLLRSLVLHREFIRIKSFFTQSNVSLVPIKGMAFIQDIYTQSLVRPMVDMDFLVREDDLLRAQSTLEKCGYKKDLGGLRESYWRNNQCHIVFWKDDEGEPKNMHIDLHWALDFKRKNRTILPQLWERLREIKIAGHTITILSPEDNLFSLALHQRRFGKIINLKYALDTALILRKYDDFDWDYIIRESHQGKMGSCVFFILSQTKYFLGTNIPPEVQRALGVSSFKQKIIRNFIAKNAFRISNMNNLKKIYLSSHFLLYDTFREPIEYIIKIPQEQFAKFYGLNPYTKQTQFYYNNRLWYMPFRFIKEKVKG